MGEAAWEIVVAPAARQFLLACTDSEKQELDRLIRSIELDPFIDGRVKVRVDLPPVVVMVYTHRNWFILYHGPDRGRVVIEAIARREPPPRWAPSS